LDPPIFLRDIPSFDESRLYDLFQLPFLGRITRDSEPTRTIFHALLTGDETAFPPHFLSGRIALNDEEREKSVRAWRRERAQNGTVSKKTVERITSEEDRKRLNRSLRTVRLPSKVDSPSLAPHSEERDAGISEGNFRRARSPSKKPSSRLVFRPEEGAILQLKEAVPAQRSAPEEDSAPASEKNFRKARIPRKTSPSDQMLLSEKSATRLSENSFTRATSPSRKRPSDLVFCPEEDSAPASEEDLRNVIPPPKEATPRLTLVAEESVERPLEKSLRKTRSSQRVQNVNRPVRSKESMNPPLEKSFRRSRSPEKDGFEN
jgi:hypothetical protein